MELRAKITSKGQLTIPKEARGEGGGGQPSLRRGRQGARGKVRVERKCVSFVDYEGACRKGEGMDWEEIDAYMKELRGYRD